MVSPVPKPQPPRPRSANKTDTTEVKASVKPDAKPSGKLSLFARYNGLSLKVKLYIWITTAGAAWLADSLSDRIFEQNMIDAEANRRVDIELRRIKELEINEAQLRNSK